MENNIKKDLKEIRKSIKDYGLTVDYNQINYGDLISFILKSIKNLDDRLDVIEAKNNV